MGIWKEVRRKRKWMRGGERGDRDDVPRRAATPSARQQQAIEALRATGDVTIAAQSVGVNRTTLYRWMKQPVFVQAVHSAAADAVEDLTRMLLWLRRPASPP
jgi:DNA invertase Pin-like site-specific DNA recombinase